VQATEHVRRRREQRHADFSSHHDRIANVILNSTQTNNNDNNNQGFSSISRVSSSITRDYSPDRAERRMRLAAIQQQQQQQRNQPGGTSSGVALLKRRSMSSSPTRSDLIRDAIVSELLREKTRRQQRILQGSVYQQQLDGFDDTSAFDPFGLHTTSTTSPRVRIDKPYTPPRELQSSTTIPRKTSAQTDHRGRRVRSSSTDATKKDLDLFNNISSRTDTRHSVLSRWADPGQQRTETYISPPTSISNTSSTNSGIVNYMPSPAHPSTSHTVPNDKIVLETMKHLQSGGIRLLAHGIHVVEPKRVWIKYDRIRKCIVWQSENPRKIVDGSSNIGGDDGANAASSLSAPLVLVRGALHTIPISSILYIDVGQKTLAFLKPKGSNVKMPSPTWCFSLLTNDGSLDLQANSKLERDVLVSCLCWIVDYTQGNDSWRRLYGESSVVGSADKSNDVASNDGSSTTSQLHQQYVREIYSPLSAQLLSIVMEHSGLQHEDDKLNEMVPRTSLTSKRDGGLVAVDRIAAAQSSLAARTAYLATSAADSPRVTGRSSYNIPPTSRASEQQESSGSSYSGISTAIISLSAEEI
jgi:hypothetical protein